MSCASFQRRLTGAIQSRTSSVVACSETASCERLRAQKRRISGTRPTVETVTCQKITQLSIKGGAIAIIAKLLEATMKSNFTHGKVGTEDTPKRLQEGARAIKDGEGRDVTD